MSQSKDEKKETEARELVKVQQRLSGIERRLKRLENEVKVIRREP